MIFLPTRGRSFFSHSQKLPQSLAWGHSLSNAYTLPFVSQLKICYIWLIFITQVCLAWQEGLAGALLPGGAYEHEKQPGKSRRKIPGVICGDMVPAWPGIPEAEGSRRAQVPVALLLLLFRFQHRVSWIVAPGTQERQIKAILGVLTCMVISLPNYRWGVAWEATSECPCSLPAQLCSV